MVYKALYRTYRPQKFSEVIGQDHIVRTLQNSITYNKTSHAYLFSGPRGTGKTSVARIFAKALNCAAPKNLEPCGECTSCQEIATSMSPDVVEIDAASNNGVDEIREIRDKVKFLPGGSKYKIYIIDEVHMLSQGAFNALLKTLEEPPKHVIFILATTEPHKVIPTILSRCQRFDFKTLSVQEISSVIKSVALKENFEISDEAIVAIAEGAEGGMRDALSFLDQAASFTDNEITIDDVNSVTGNLNYDKIVELAKFFDEKNINKALKTINDLIIMGKEINKIVSSLLQFYRDCLLFKNIDTSMFSKYIFEKEDFKQLANKISDDKIFYYIDVLSEVQTKIKTSSTPAIYLEVATIKMINSSEDDFLYNKRINELEEKIAAINISPEGFMGSDSNGKIDSIEQRLNKVIAELSRLELHKLSERVDNLQNTTPSSSVDFSKVESELVTLKSFYTNLENKLNEVKAKPEVIATNVDSYEEEISELKDEFLNLKEEINSLKININNLPTTNSESSTSRVDADERIQKLKDIILGMQSDIYALRSQKPERDDINLDDIKSELDDIYANKFARIENELIKFKTESNPKTSSSNMNIDYELDIIKEKINSIESKLYKVLSGELEKVEPKRSRIKIKSKQIGLFGDEIINLNDFKKPIKESVDFEDVKNEDVLEEDLDAVEEKTESVQTLENEEVDITDEESFDKTEEILNYEYGSSMFAVDNEELDSEELNYENKNISSENKAVKTITTEDEEIIEREHSQLVRRINTDPGNIIDEKSEISLGMMKKENRVDEVLIEDEETTSNTYIPPTELVNDEYSNYSVTVLERILHDSRTEEARDDKARIVKLWKNMDRNVPQSQSHIASLLQDGKLVATGKKEFVIVYPNAALCNQVMRLSFKKDALKLLYDFLGDTYNYFAIPEDIWLEKRTEYINQYNIGTRFPKLTPINDSRLNVIEENKNFLKKEDTPKSKAISFFGEELVKVE